MHSYGDKADDSEPVYCINFAGYTAFLNLRMILGRPSLVVTATLLMAVAVSTGCSSVVERESHQHRTTTLTQESVHYYIGKLPDRDYVDIYGGPEHPRLWYTAAEELGQIGAAAIPALVERLDTPDSYELMLVLYALMLASQDPVLMATSGGDYLQLQTVLTEETNDENRRRALAWWQRWCEATGR